MARRKTPEPEPKQPNQRQPRTRIDDLIGNYLTEIRNSHESERDWELRPIAERMDTIDGEPHDSVARWRALLADEETLPKAKVTTYINSLSKAPLAVEGLGRGKAKPKGATTVSQLYAYCNAIGQDIGRVLEATGIAKPSRSIEDAINGDGRLNENGKDRLRVYLGILLADPATRR